MEAMTTTVAAAATASAAATARENWWWVFSLSLAGKWGSATANPLNVFSFAILFLLAWLLVAAIRWLFPGGHAWGKYWLARGLFHYPVSTIPGPRGLPFVGSIRIMSGLAHRSLAKEADRLKAQRLMAFSIGDNRAIVTSNPDVAKEILNSSAFVDRPAKDAAYRHMFHRSIGFAPYGVYWRTLRKIAATHLFSPKQITMSGPLRSEIAAEMVGEIRKMTKGGLVPVRPRDVMKLAALNHMMWLMFGQRYVIRSDQKKHEVDELHRLVEEGYDLLGMVNLSDHIPFLSNFDLQGIQSRCNKLVPRVNTFVRNIIREHQNGTLIGNGESFIDVLFSLQSSENPSDDDIVAVLWEMIFRGTDTVAVLMEWIMARVVLHPDVQRKAQEELDRVVTRSKPVTETDLASLAYIKALVKETLRLHPPGPLLSWARLSTHDSTVDGHHVPAGTTAMVNMWAITHDPHVWDDPWEFRPERFLGNGSEMSVFGSDLRLAPFGSGRRSCPGKAMGLSTVEFWVATLFHEYEWYPTVENGCVDLSEKLRLTCEMAVPLMVKARPRCC